MQSKDTLGKQSGGLGILTRTRQFETGQNGRGGKWRSSDTVLLVQKRLVGQVVADDVRRVSGVHDDGRDGVLSVERGDHRLV